MSARCVELGYWNLGWATGFFILVTQVATGHPKLISQEEEKACNNFLNFDDSAVPCQRSRRWSQ